MDRIAGMGCLVCGRGASLHHEHEPGARRDHQRTVPLCYEHHQGQTGRHGLGSHNAFEIQYGVNLQVMAGLLWAESMRLWNG